MHATRAIVFVPASLFALVSCATPASRQASEPGSSVTMVASLGQAIISHGSIFTPIALLEDSRCPINARCIHAGTVRLQLTVQEGARARAVEVALQKPAVIGTRWLHLAAVCPAPVAPAPASRPPYRFHFRVLNTSVTLPSAASCD